jgi:hypothetical protein
LREAQRVQGSEEMAATKPLSVTFWYRSRACSSRYAMSGEDIAQFPDKICQARAARMRSGAAASVWGGHACAGSLGLTILNRD